MSVILKTTKLRCFDFLSYPPLALEKGKITFLVGESGSGKSTLLKVLNGTLTPQEGKVYYKDRDIEILDTIALRRDMILASQEVYLFEGSIQENFEQFYQYREADCIKPEEMAQYLSICCADFPLDSPCVTLSGGERQRVFLAICLSFLPEILMLDEPTASLDESTSTRFFERLKRFATERSMTLLVICHNRAMVSRYADALISLEGREVD